MLNLYGYVMHMGGNNYLFNGMFDPSHAVELIEAYVNDQPILIGGAEYLIRERPAIESSDGQIKLKLRLSGRYKRR